jgi:hypothetical protein
LKMVNFRISWWRCTMYSNETNSTTNPALSRCYQYWWRYLVRAYNFTRFQ